MAHALSILTALAVALFPALAFASGGEAKAWYTGITPILLLLVAVAIVVWRLPKVQGLPHLDNQAYRRRRALNWLVAGMTYAFLYWGRYNLQPAIEALGGKNMIADFNAVFTAGTWVYGLSFLVNGPLTDRFGGRFSIIVAAAGAGIANLLMGLMTKMHLNGNLSADGLFWWLVVLYPLNMYFQSFGAVAIVKVNAHWFHVRERGTFGAIFGILISLGIYFAYDWSNAIVKVLPVSWAFSAPSIALLTMFVACLLFVRNEPSKARFTNILTGDASEGDTGPRLGAAAVFKLMLQNKVIMTIAVIELCSGFLRQAIMQMYRFYVKTSGAPKDFVYQNWGMTLCVAGILGGVFAGTISDHLFNSRRGPVAAVLYAFMIAGVLGMFFLLGKPELGWIAAFVSLSVIGVHGMLSGTASQDFGGTRNVGVAVGIIDGFVYLGTGMQSAFYYFALPRGPEEVGAADISNWYAWPGAMLPLAVLGFVLAWRIRNERPRPKLTVA